MIKESYLKPFKMLKIVVLVGGGEVAPWTPTKALAWTHRGLDGSLDPSPKLVPPPPPKEQSMDSALVFWMSCHCYTKGLWKRITRIKSFISQTLGMSAR